MVNNIILYISIISFIISLLFLLIQGIYNCVYLYSSSKINILERLLFEQFSYEVYSSINNSLSESNILISSVSKCSEGYEEMRFNLNLDSFYDCRGIFSTDLDSHCRDKIIRNTTICSSDMTDYNDLNDPKLKYCTYFTNYTQPITILEERKICKSKTNFDYEELLSNSLPLYDLEGKPNNCDNRQFQNCGILDTMNNILCFPKNNNCPFNKITKDTSLGINNDNNFNSKVIVSVIVSENHPLNHEWDLIVRGINEKLNEKNIYNRKAISPVDFKLFDEEFDNTYEKQDQAQILAGQIISDNNVIEKDYSHNKKLSIYTRNYIGFKNVKELKKFKKYFKYNNNRENPLFRLSSSSHHNPIVTIAFSGFFLILSIIYGIFSSVPKFFQKDYFKYFLAIITLYFIGNLIIIIYHSIRCPMIYIEMDQRMKKVLDAYNKRTIMFQIFRYIGTLFNLASFILGIIFNCKDNKENENQNQNQGHNPVPQQDNPN